MDVSPQLLREIEFREQWRGYSPDEVDDFLERLAVAVDELQQRLRDTTERAVHAERRLLEREDDDELRRTLVLAQRTADAALQEARAEAAQLVAEADERSQALVRDAEERSQTLVRDAEERAAQVHAEASARAEAELRTLAEQRAELASDVEALQAYLGEHRARLQQDLRDQLAWLEGDRLAVRPPPPLSEVAVPAANGAAPEPPDVIDLGSGDEPPATGAYPAPDDDEDDEDDEPVDRRVLDDRALDDLPDDAAEEPGDDDPFLAELRRAVDDDEPLGPRDPEPPRSRDDTGEAMYDQDLAPSRGFRRRRRR